MKTGTYTPEGLVEYLLNTSNQLIANKLHQVWSAHKIEGRGQIPHALLCGIDYIQKRSDIVAGIRDSLALAALLPFLGIFVATCAGLSVLTYPRHSVWCFLSGGVGLILGVVFLIGARKFYKAVTLRIRADKWIAANAERIKVWNEFVADVTLLFNRFNLSLNTNNWDEIGRVVRARMEEFGMVVALLQEHGRDEWALTIQKEMEVSAGSAQKFSLCSSWENYFPRKK